MVKKFTANCDFGGKKAPVTLYIGNPSLGSHPLQFQSKWLNDNKGGMIPLDIMNSFQKLAQISEKSRVSFEDLCSYVIEELKASKSIVDDVKQATGISDSNKKKPSSGGSSSNPADSKKVSSNQTSYKAANNQASEVKSAVKPPVKKEVKQPPKQEIKDQNEE